MKLKIGRKSSVVIRKCLGYDFWAFTTTAHVLVRGHVTMCSSVRARSCHEAHKSTHTRV